MEERNELIYLGYIIGTCTGWDGCGDTGDIQFYDVLFPNGESYEVIAFFLADGTVELYNKDECVRKVDTIHFIQSNTFQKKETHD